MNRRAYPVERVRWCRAQPLRNTEASFEIHANWTRTDTATQFWVVLGCNPWAAYVSDD